MICGGAVGVARTVRAGTGRRVGSVSCASQYVVKIKRLYDLKIWSVYSIHPCDTRMAARGLTISVASGTKEVRLVWCGESRDRCALRSDVLAASCTPRCPGRRCYSQLRSACTLPCVAAHTALTIVLPHPTPSPPSLPLPPHLFAQALFAEIVAARTALQDAEAALASMEDPVAQIKVSGASSPAVTVVGLLQSKLGETSFHCTAALEMIATMRKAAST